MSEISRRTILRGTVALGAVGYAAHTLPGNAQNAATPTRQNNTAGRSMTSYIGTPTSRIDGRAKATGAAKYAGEFNTSGLAHGYIVQSTIAKGRIKSIDASEALRVEGVLDVLTHENRPPMADQDSAYHDDVAPEGSPFRPLYDGKIMFNGQPIALVLAEEWETAHFAASLVRVEYEQEAHVTDLYRQRDAAVAVKIPAKAEADPFALQNRAATPRRRWLRPRSATRLRLCSDRASQPDGTVCHHGGMEWGRQAHGLRQEPGRAERSALFMRRLRHEAGRCARHAAIYGRRVGSGLRPQYQIVLAVLAARALERSARVVLTRATDVRARLPARHDPADRVGCTS